MWGHGSHATYRRYCQPPLAHYLVHHVCNLLFCLVALISTLRAFGQEATLADPVVATNISDSGEHISILRQQYASKLSSLGGNQEAVLFVMTGGQQHQRAVCKCTSCTVSRAPYPLAALYAELLATILRARGQQFASDLESSINPERSIAVATTMACFCSLPGVACHAC